MSRILGWLSMSNGSGRAVLPLARVASCDLLARILVRKGRKGRQKGGISIAVVGAI
jgi:hypothetical protein